MVVCLESALLENGPYHVIMLFQVTLMNVLGMSAAIGGVFMYNMVKYHEKLAKETLPTQNNKTTSLWANGNLGRYSMPLWRKLTETIETCVRQASGRMNEKNDCYQSSTAASNYPPECKRIRRRTRETRVARRVLQQRLQEVIASSETTHCTL